MNEVGVGSMNEEQIGEDKPSADAYIERLLADNDRMRDALRAIVRMDDTEVRTEARGTARKGLGGDQSGREVQP